MIMVSGIGRRREGGEVGAFLTSLSGLSAG